jgi:hypothetical protein
MTANCQTRPAEEVLRLVADGTASTTGADFFNALVQCTARAKPSSVATSARCWRFVTG